MENLRFQLPPSLIINQFLRVGGAILGVSVPVLSVKAVTILGAATIDGSMPRFAIGYSVEDILLVQKVLGDSGQGDIP